MTDPQAPRPPEPDPADPTPRQATPDDTTPAEPAAGSGPATEPAPAEPAADSGPVAAAEPSEPAAGSIPAGSTGDAGPAAPPTPSSGEPQIRYGLDDPAAPPAPAIRYGLDDEPPGAAAPPPGADGPPPGAGAVPPPAGGVRSPGQGVPPYDTGYGAPPPEAPPYGGGYGAPPTGGFAVPGASPGAPDPITGPPDGGFEGWAGRTVAICRRSMGPALGILAAAAVVPTAAGAVLALLMNDRVNQVTPADSTRITPSELGELYATMFGWLGLVLGVGLVLAYLTSVGWVATLRVMATDAAGAPRDIGAALRFSLRRALPLWGWYALAYLCALVGLCFCVVPGIYLSLALSLIAPITVFERGAAAFSRSFRLMHSYFWPAVGRLVVLGLVVGVYAMLLSCVVGAATGTTSLDPDAQAAVGIGPVLLSGILQAVLALPATVVGIAGILALYGEIRARQEPTTARSLADAD